MVDLVPVDHDPFSGSRINLIPVEHDPFSDSGISLIAVDHDPFGEPPPAIVPMGFEDTFVPPDPSQWPRIGTVPRIIVHPKEPPSAFDGIDAAAPGQANHDGSDDWIGPTPSAAPSTGQFAPGTQPAVNPAGFNPPAMRPDPSAADWSLMPASGAGAMAWHPPIFLGDSLTFPTVKSFTPAWPQASPPWAGLQNVPTTGGILGGLAQLGSSSPDPGSTFQPPPQSQSASAQPVSTEGRRPLTDYSTGEILGDAAKSFGLGVGQLGIQGAGLLGDAREAIANGVQRAADYFAPGSAPNAGSKASDFLASYPVLGGPTSSQLQSAVESYTGPFYQPKTIVGDYARTAGEFVPGALLMPEGSLATNALRYGLLPAFSSETAGQLTKGTTAEPWARAFGALLGAALSARGNLPWARSAPESAETVPPRPSSPIGGTTSEPLPSAAGRPTYLYQKVGPNGEHLKFGITNSPGTRYSQKKLGGGRLRIIGQGSRQEMLALERSLHEALPIGPEEGQQFYIQNQISKGLRAPPY
jgi:hypothetical protein